MVTRRAAEVHTLLDRGMFDEAMVPLRNGGTLPAAMFADVALGDLGRLTELNADGEVRASGVS
jgi:hypothetical protein